MVDPYGSNVVDRPFSWHSPKKQPFEYINKKIKKDRVEIVKLFGNNNEL